ncbi:MAG: hypothetical protein KAY32_14695 [Candidatus Eisenbacteria sp.]|nr:hypothetical protein [Candidatus Eisenbacteria bacterium]
MRVRVLLILIFQMSCAAAALAERGYQEDVRAVAGCSGMAESRELGCEIVECTGYATAADWADEVQVRFLLPAAPHGGPWALQYVAFFLSGSGEHRVLIRSSGVSSSTPPGTLLSDDVVFAPGYQDWPPSDWTYVTLAGATPPYPETLIIDAGEAVTLGVALALGDRIGLVAAEQTPGVGWGHHAGAWHADSDDHSLAPAIRIGLADLGSSDAESDTWGIIKGLFK